MTLVGSVHYSLHGTTLLREVDKVSFDVAIYRLDVFTRVLLCRSCPEFGDRLCLAWSTVGNLGVMKLYADLPLYPSIPSLRRKYFVCLFLESCDGGSSSIE